MQKPIFSSSVSNDIPEIDDIDGVTVKVVSRRQSLRDARRIAAWNNQPLPTEPPEELKFCDVCGCQMDVQRERPAVDHPDLEEIVGEGPYDLFWCPHRHKEWHIRAQVLWYRIHGQGQLIRNTPSLSHRQKDQLAQALETLVNTHLERHTDPKVLDTRCEGCGAQLLQRPHAFTIHSFGAAMAGYYSWGIKSFCPNQNSPQHPLRWKKTPESRNRDL